MTQITTLIIIVPLALVEVCNFQVNQYCRDINITAGSNDEERIVSYVRYPANMFLFNSSLINTISGIASVYNGQYYKFPTT